MSFQTQFQPAVKNDSLTHPHDKGHFTKCESEVPGVWRLHNMADSKEDGSAIKVSPGVRLYPAYNVSYWRGNRGAFKSWTVFSDGTFVSGSWGLTALHNIHLVLQRREATSNDCLWLKIYSLFHMAFFITDIFKNVGIQFFLSIIRSFTYPNNSLHEVTLNICSNHKYCDSLRQRTIV